MFLIVSELSILKPYFNAYWPLLSEKSGFLCLGLAMLILGFNILGNLNKPATSIQNLGLPLWRVVIAGGILNSIFGCTNIIAVSTNLLFSSSNLLMSASELLLR